jgi:hypothetical protein
MTSSSQNLVYLPWPTRSVSNIVSQLLRLWQPATLPLVPWCHSLNSWISCLLQCFLVLCPCIALAVPAAVALRMRQCILRTNLSKNNNDYNGGWPSARLFGWSAADWSRPQSKNNCKEISTNSSSKSPSLQLTGQKLKQSLWTLWSIRP